MLKPDSVQFFHQNLNYTKGKTSHPQFLRSILLYMCKLHTMGEKNATLVAFSLQVRLSIFACAFGYIYQSKMFYSTLCKRGNSARKNPLTIAYLWRFLKCPKATEIYFSPCHITGYSYIHICVIFHTGEKFSLFP